MGTKDLKASMKIFSTFCRMKSFLMTIDTSCRALASMIGLTFFF